jgi:hypothetical protein
MDQDMEPHRSHASRKVSSATSGEATVLRASALLQFGPDAENALSGLKFIPKVPRVTQCNYPVIYRVAEGAAAAEPFATPRIPSRNGGPAC